LKPANTIIIGASAAGLATAACLKKNGIPYVLLEKENHVGHSWRNHYDRLHLHTNKGSSGLPHFKIPSSWPKYPSRDEFVRYLELYTSNLELKPLFGQEVTNIAKVGENWRIKSTSDVFEGKNVVVCTGYTRMPNIPHWPGMDSFDGQILHSSQYKNGSDFRNKKVLVVGFGNSACEIAICLHEHGAYPSMSVRGPVNILPKEIFGIPVLGIGIALSIFPPKIGDLLGKPAVLLTVGNPEKYGLKKPPFGPIEQIVRKRRIPLLDIGTLRLIKNGSVKVFDDIDSFNSNAISFKNGSSEEFDAVILGTGYKPIVGDFFQSTEKVCDETGNPSVSGRESSIDGLYFCGFYVSPTGMLREINLEARKISRNIAALSG
jgi:thioredoxin reductase